MQGSQVQLSAGDDNSIQITPEHNHNIQATGPKHNITRASPIAERELESPVPPLKAHEMDQKWTVSENGDIVAILSQEHILSTPLEPSPSFNKLGVPSLKDSDDSNPPILTKASSDSISEASNELILPESPPRMNRSVYDKSLFEESSRSSSGTRSRSTPSPVIDMVEVQNAMEDMPEDAKKRGGFRGDFIGQILDLFNVTCGGGVCRDVNCLSSNGAQAA